MIRVSEDREQYREVGAAAFQVPLDEWPQGVRGVAFTLKRSQAALAKQLHVQFEADCDSLDAYDAVVLRIPNFDKQGGARHIVFQAYRNDPEPAIHVIPDVASEKLIHFLVRFLKIGAKEIGWASPSAKHKLNRQLKRSEEKSPVPRRRSLRS